MLDDGWFHLRRDDHAGLGDWWVDPDVWPEGLHPLVDFVHEQGMQFGLWFEPEMVNPDSDLYREHPDWVLQAAPRTPILQRHQLVLDLANPEAFDHVYRAIHDVLSQYRIDYIKWDHNRYLLEAGSNLHGGAASIHNQTVAYYRLLDKLRADFPDIEWESCASGGGRIDTGVIEHVQRCWTSDMTDAAQPPMHPAVDRTEHRAPNTWARLSLSLLRSRPAVRIRLRSVQQRPCSTASVSNGTSPKPATRIYRSLPLGSFGTRPIVTSCIPVGRAARCGGPGRARTWRGGCDGSRALIAHVQYEEFVLEPRRMAAPVPDSTRCALCCCAGVGPEPARASLEPIDPLGPVGSRSVSGAWLASPGVRVPRCRPETVRLVEIVKV